MICRYKAEKYMKTDLHSCHPPFFFPHVEEKKDHWRMLWGLTTQQSYLAYLYCHMPYKSEDCPIFHTQQGVFRISIEISWQWEKSSSAENPSLSFLLFLKTCMEVYRLKFATSSNLTQVGQNNLSNWKPNLNFSDYMICAPTSTLNIRKYVFPYHKMHPKNGLYHTFLCELAF